MARADVADDPAGVVGGGIPYNCIVAFGHTTDAVSRARTKIKASTKTSRLWSICRWAALRAIVNKTAKK